MFMLVQRSAHTGLRLYARHGLCTVWSPVACCCGCMASDSLHVHLTRMSLCAYVCILL